MDKPITFTFPSGRTFTVEPAVRSDSKQATTKSFTPSLGRQMWTYSKAIAKWKTAGSPTRTQDEIDAVLKICEACPNYKNDGRPRCSLCGCSINNSPNGLVNKVAMKTETCPDTPPRW